MMIENIEDAILSTFLYANDLDLNLAGVFKLDSEIFSTEYRKSVARSINNVKNGYYCLLSIKLEEKSMGTEYEYDFLNILAQTPLTFSLAERYYLYLQKEFKLGSII